MKVKLKTQTTSLDHDLIRLARVHFAYAALLAAQIIIFHTSHLITPEIVLKRWELTAALFVVAIFVWYVARTKRSAIHLQRWLVLALISVDIAVAAFSIYYERGMGSLSVALFAVPIVVSTVLRSRAAIFATAGVCVATYSTAAVKYFIDFFNEGYNAQLYGTIGFYSGMFIVLAALLSAVLHPKKNS